MERERESERNGEREGESERNGEREGDSDGVISLGRVAPSSQVTAHPITMLTAIMISKKKRFPVISAGTISYQNILKQCLTLHHLCGRHMSTPLSLESEGYFPQGGSLSCSDDSEGQ